jgi:hypothetical protein
VRQYEKDHVSRPFQVESLEDGIDDSIYGLHVNEADRAAVNFDKADEGNARN